MVSIAVDLDRLGIRIVQVVVESLGAEDQTAMATVVQVHEDPLESCPVDFARVVGEGRQLVDGKQDVGVDDHGLLGGRLYGGVHYP